jgi:hypothetical protein
MDRTGEPLATHQLSNDKGKLIKLASHRRDKQARIEALRDKTVALLGEEFREYLTILCEKKPRYVKEQLDLVTGACEMYGRERVLIAMRYCQAMALYSANDLKDAAEAIGGQTPSQPQSERLPVEDERYHIQVQKRELSVYAEVAAESGAIR